MEATIEEAHTREDKLAADNARLREGLENMIIAYPDLERMAAICNSLVKKEA
jgi:hypothetical protein